MFFPGREQSCQFRTLTFFPCLAATDHIGSPCIHHFSRLSPASSLSKSSLVFRLNMYSPTTPVVLGYSPVE